MLFNREFCFYNPPKIDVVIFDEMNSELIIDNILKGISYYIYKARSEKLFISPKILCYFGYSLKFFSWKFVVSQNYVLRSIKTELFNHWRWSVFQVMNPKIVLTTIDNDMKFHWLAKKHLGTKYLAIQNGNRQNEQLDIYQKQYHQIFFCFGDYDKDRYKKFGHPLESCYPVGSFKMGIYENKYKKNTSPIYDISIVSEYRSYIEQNPNELPYNLLKRQRISSKMHKLLAKYINERQIKSCIILSGINIEKQIEYFKNFYRDSVEYKINYNNIFGSYQTISNSNVVVGFSSTLISEAFGLNKKVLRIDFSDSNDINDYEDMILIKNPTYEELAERLNQLMVETYESYLKRTKEYASYVMNYNPELPPHKVIRQTILKYL
jgi:surface carbohydrate biosynthesis protein